MISKLPWRRVEKEEEEGQVAVMCGWAYTNPKIKAISIRNFGIVLIE